jgi:galactose oxidase
MTIHCWPCVNKMGTIVDLLQLSANACRMYPLHAIAIILAFLGSRCVAQDPALPRAGWTVAADSEQAPDNVAANVIDGNTATIWHTQFVDATPGLPHFITLTMGGQTNKVSGVSILPRQDAAANANGNIGNYEIHLSADGTTFPAAPVATGTLADTQTLKTATFTATNAKAVRIRALSEAGDSGPWISAAEINVLGTTAGGTGGGAPLDRSSWYAVASSAEYPNLDAPGKVLDGDDNSLWHSAYTPTFDALPHTISLFFGGATNKVSSLIYKPRLDATGPNGRIGNFEVRISTNGATFPAVTTVAKGTFDDTADQKTVTFTAVNAKGIQLKALTEAGNRGPWSSAAEILVTGTPVTAAPKKTVGAWGALIPFPLVPVAAALLPDGKVSPSGPIMSFVLLQFLRCRGGSMMAALMM